MTRKCIQLSFLDGDIVKPDCAVQSDLSSTSAKCWRCQQYYPISRIRVFSIRDLHGYIGDYQACDACHKVMTSSEEYGW